MWWELSWKLNKWQQGITSFVEKVLGLILLVSTDVFILESIYIPVSW